MQQKRNRYLEHPFWVEDPLCVEVEGLGAGVQHVFRHLAQEVGDVCQLEQEEVAG